MKARYLLLALTVTLAAVGCNGDTPTRSTQTGGTGGGTTTMTFFVSSARSATGNLGGLRGADTLCQTLATGAGVGNRTWRAYLSVERDADNGNRSTDARSRIGVGPWHNFAGALVAWAFPSGKAAASGGVQRVVPALGSLRVQF